MTAPRTDRTYTFVHREACIMCGSSAGDHRVLGKRLNGSQGRSPASKAGITVSVKQCRRCGLIFPYPLPIPASIQDHYSMPPEDYWKPEYFHMPEGQYDAVIAITKELLGHRSTPIGLDVGGGLGFCSVAYQRAGFDMHALEASASFHRMAVERMHMDPQRFRLGMVESAEFPEAMFDFINLDAVLEHVYDPDHVLRKLLRWLKPDGILHVEVPSSRWLVARAINAYYRLARGRHVTNLSPMHPPYHLHEFDPRSFELHGLRAGYRIARYRPIVGRSMISPLVDRILQPIMRRTHSGMEFDVWLARTTA